MTRRLPPPLPRLLLLSLLLLGALIAAGGCRRGGGAPTVVLVTIDTLRADRVGCYGRTGAGTPVLDRLAADGTRFDAAQTTAPITVPAHASILTGRSLPAHGVVFNRGYAISSSVPVATESFRAAGYATGAFVSSKILVPRLGFGRGFDTYDDGIDSGDPRRGPVLGIPERAGRETVAAALGWLRGVPRDRPVLLWVHLWEPHAPYTPPGEFRTRYPDDPYQGEVAAADAALGELLAGIDDAGRGRQLVVVAGDHGEGLGDHGEASHGVFLYEEVMRVPLVVHGPDWGVRTQVIGEPVSLADLAPTLLELTALAPLRGTDGASLAAAVTGRGPLPARPGVFAESHLPQIEYDWSGLRALVRGSLKVIEAPRPELYDLAADPRERQDLAAERPADVAGGLDALTDLRRRALASAPTAEESVSSVSDEDLKNLQALGYAASGRRGDPQRDLVDPDAPDPKDRAGFLDGFHRAMQIVQQGRPREAIPVFEDLLSVEPRNVSLLMQYGQSLILSGFLDRALAVFRSAVEIDPGFAIGWLRIGQILDAREDRAGAEEAYRSAIEANAETIQAYKALAGLLAESGRLDEAVALLELAQKLDPSDAAITNDLARFKGTAPR